MKCIYIYIFSTKVVAFRYEYLDISTVFENSTEKSESGYKGGACIYLETERRGKDKKWTTLDIINNHTFVISKYSSNVNNFDRIKLFN